jgi:hypothetical protein
MDELGLRVARKVAETTSRRGFLGWIGKGAAIALGVATAGAVGTESAAAAPKKTRCCLYQCGDRLRKRCLEPTELCPTIAGCTRIGTTTASTCKEACEFIVA